MRATYFIFTLLSFFLFSNCQNNTEETKQNEDVIISEIDSLVNVWHQSASNSNFDAYFNLMDSNSIFIGTDASENWTKKEFKVFSKPYFDDGKAWDFKPLDRNIYLNQNYKVAWFDELLNTWMGTCRGSGVFEKIDNQWKLKHYVLSLTIPNEIMDSVITIVK